MAAHACRVWGPAHHDADQWHTIWRCCSAVGMCAGYDMAMPVLVAPMAMHGLAHASKELGTAAGAAAACTPMVVSTMATTGLQEVSAGTPNACLLFQLYIIRDRSIVEGWVRQAEAAGYRAIVVTVDAQRLGRREADERNRCVCQGADHSPSSGSLLLGAQLAQLTQLAHHTFFLCRHSFSLWGPMQVSAAKPLAARQPGTTFRQEVFTGWQRC